VAYRGLIATIPVGLQGFNGSKNASKLGPGNFGYVEGVDVDGGVLVKDGGAAKLNATTLGAFKVMAGINWSPAPGNDNDVVFLSNGTLKKDTGAGTFATTLESGLGVPTVFPPFFVRAGGEVVGSTRKLFMFNEAAQVRVISGTAATSAAISTPPADWASSFPICGAQHANRLWGAGNANDPHRLYYSNPANHQDFTTALVTGTLAVYPGEGEQIVGMISFRGLLVVFKYPTGIYLVDTRDPTIANWRVDKLNTAIGACSPWCIVQISNDVLVLDSAGNFHTMSAVTDFSDIATSDVSRAENIGPFMRANVGLTNMRKAMGLWYAAKTKAWFMVPLAGSADNNLRIMVDFNDAQAGARFYLYRRDIGCSLWTRPDSLFVRRPTLGDNAGFVWLMDQDARDKAGAAYLMYMETSETDFSFVDPQLAPHTKNGQYIEIVADLVRNSKLNVVPVWDGAIGDPIIMEFGSTAAALGSFVLDVDALSASGIVIATARLPGQGRRLKLIISNEELDDEVRMSEIRVGFTVGDERLQQ
jgi:hypothetical protein